MFKLMNNQIYIKIGGYFLPIRIIKIKKMINSQDQLAPGKQTLTHSWWELQSGFRKTNRECFAKKLLNVYATWKKNYYMFERNNKVINSNETIF